MFKVGDRINAPGCINTGLIVDIVGHNYLISWQLPAYPIGYSFAYLDHLMRTNGWFIIRKTKLTLRR